MRDAQKDKWKKRESLNWEAKSTSSFKREGGDVRETEQQHMDK